MRMARINNKGKIKGRSDKIYPVRNIVQVFIKVNMTLSKHCESYSFIAMHQQ